MCITNEEESWYLLDGEMAWIVGNKEIIAKQGSFIHLPRLLPHTFANKSHKPAQMITTYAPAGFKNWFLEIGTPAIDLQELTPPEVTEENMKKAGELAKKYGLISTGHKDSDHGHPDAEISWNCNVNFVILLLEHLH